MAERFTVTDSQIDHSRRRLLWTAVALIAAAVLLPIDSARATDSADTAPAGVVSLGDSYSSGLGAGGYDDDCDRTQQAWGMLIFEDAVAAEDRLLLACSGAEIPDIYDQLDELPAGGSGGRLITLTVGGNDVGFAGELANCFVPFVSCVDRESALMDEIAALGEPLAELYRAVQAAAPGDELIVGGYPLLVQDPDVRDRCRALTPLLSGKERQMIRRLGLALNDAIDEAAAAAGVRSAGTQLEEVFEGHEACANGPDDWLNGLKLGGSAEELDEDSPEARWDGIVEFVRESFHPNAAGQAGYADAFTSIWNS